MLQQIFAVNCKIESITQVLKDASITFHIYQFYIIGIPVVAILAAIPWLLPWDEITVPYLPIFHVVSSVAPWIGSTLYHLFMNHNTGYIAYKVLLTIDMLGIWVTQTAGKLYLHYS